MLTVGTHPTDDTLFLVFDEEGDKVAHARLVLEAEEVPVPGMSAPLGLRIVWRKPLAREEVEDA